MDLVTGKVFSSPTLKARPRCWIQRSILYVCLFTDPLLRIRIKYPSVKLFVKDPKKVRSSFRFLTSVFSLIRCHKKDFLEYLFVYSFVSENRVTPLTLLTLHTASEVHAHLDRPPPLSLSLLKDLFPDGLNTGQPGLP